MEILPLSEGRSDRIERAMTSRGHKTMENPRCISCKKPTTQTTVLGRGEVYIHDDCKTTVIFSEGDDL